MADKRESKAGKRGPSPRDTGTQLGVCTLCGRPIDHDEDSDLCEKCFVEIVDS